MNKTFRISFSLKNAYRVNTVLFSLKQIPIVKKLLPVEVYQAKSLKIFANIISILWEIIAAFLGKLLYVLTMVFGIGALYKGLPEREVFLHILLFLTMIGGFVNTQLFNPTKDKYYAISLMRMDAKEYTVVNYCYHTFKLIIGFLPFLVLFGGGREVWLWLCMLLPFCIAGMKAFSIAIFLWNYEKRGRVYNEGILSKIQWGLVGILLAAAYALPAAGYVLPVAASSAVFLISIPLGVAGVYKIATFSSYQLYCKELLRDVPNTMQMTDTVKKVSEGKISADTTIISNKKGFEYLNDLFIKRHKKILWSATKKITGVCLVLFAALQIAMIMKPQIKAGVNGSVMTVLPYFTFIMFCMNRGSEFTQALFMNCDHCLLSYAFYKRPGDILRLFVIRLREITKINAVPALVIGGGLALSLYTSGGTKQLLDYVVLVVSILCMSLFFSVHYLTIYYLLQPYTAGTELRGGMYRFVITATYILCYFLMQQKIPILLFGTMTILFVLFYCVIAGILVYRFAPRTFKIRT